MSAPLAPAPEPEEAPSPEAAPGPSAEPLPDEVRRNRRLDLAACLLASGYLSVLEMGGAIAKRGFQATDLEVALLTSGQSAGLLASFFIAHLAQAGPKIPLVFRPEVSCCLFLLGVFFLAPTQALAFVVLHALAQMCYHMTTPARVTIYRLNYPSHRRGRIVGRNRQLQLVLTALFALAISLALDWNLGEKRLVGLLGPSPLPPHLMVNVAIPATALLGIAGAFTFRRIRVREEHSLRRAAGSLRDTFRKFVKVWREDRDFRRYENFFFLFGFANIMSIPLTSIHAVEELQADYFDLALINVVLVQGIMAITMARWGRLLDRHSPGALRGVLNLIFSVDFLVLAVAPTIGWVYLGRVFRGVALGGGTLVWMLGSLYYARSSELAPIYLGIHTVLTGLRWLVAPFAGVLLKQAFGHNARPIFLASFVLIVVSALFMIREARRQTPRRPPDEETMPAPRPTGA